MRNKMNLTVCNALLIAVLFLTFSSSAFAAAADSKESLSSILVEWFLTWLPMLLLIGVWVFFSKKMLMKGKTTQIDYLHNIEVLTAQQVTLLEKQVNVLERHAEAMERVADALEKKTDAR